MHHHSYPARFAAWLLVQALCVGGMQAHADVAPFKVSDRTVLEHVKNHANDGVRLAQEIFDHAELGYKETKSTQTLQAALKQAGFKVAAGVGGIPTAFRATYGKGQPVIGILAEFDALPGLSQTASPKREAATEGAPGHACGHHLFGAASVTAGLAIADWLKSTGASGTINVFGTPAEEGGSGKVYLAREGVFDGVDVMLHWHPDDVNSAGASTTTANKSGRFSFYGQAAHAAGAPERGRSALDAVEAMNHMVNLMREHMPSTSRIHYVITNGGVAPNIVPEYAEVYYYVRHPDRDMASELFDRVVNIASAAAQGTETRMEVEVMHGNYPVLPNETLAKLVDANLRSLGGIKYNKKERRFAQALREALPGDPKKFRPLASAAEVAPYRLSKSMGSTDVGDVSWQIPTVGFRVATWVPATPAHSWQAVAAGGMSIGHKGMVRAAEVLALTASQLFLDEQTIARAKQEFKLARGADFKYRPLLGDREPPLNYRDY